MTNNIFVRKNKRIFFQIWNTGASHLVKRYELLCYNGHAGTFLYEESFLHPVWFMFRVQCYIGNIRWISWRLRVENGRFVIGPRLVIGSRFRIENRDFPRICFEKRLHDTSVDIGKF